MHCQMNNNNNNIIILDALLLLLLLLMSCKVIVAHAAEQNLAEMGSHNYPLNIRIISDNKVQFAITSLFHLS